MCCIPPIFIFLSIVYGLNVLQTVAIFLQYTIIKYIIDCVCFICNAIIVIVFIMTLSLSLLFDNCFYIFIYCHCFHNVVDVTDAYGIKPPDTLFFLHILKTIFFIQRLCNNVFACFKISFSKEPDLKSLIFTGIPSSQYLI